MYIINDPIPSAALHNKSTIMGMIIINMILRTSIFSYTSNFLKGWYTHNQLDILY